MRSIIVALGVLYVIECIAILLTPEFYRKILKFFSRGKLIYVAAVAKILFGIFFIAAATQCAHPMIIIVLGILMCAGGLLAFTVKFAKLKSFLEWTGKRSDMFFSNRCDIRSCDWNADHIRRVYFGVDLLSTYDYFYAIKKAERF